ncbi:hypothetical protein D9M68_605500 [compost metagenome]
MSVHAAQAVTDNEVLVQADVHAVAQADTVPGIADHPVAPQQVVRAFVKGDAIGAVLVHLVVGHEVADAVAVEDDAGKLVVVDLVVEDPAVVDLAGNDDAVLLAGPAHGVVGDDQPLRAVVRVDAVDLAVAVGVALEHHVPGLVAVEAEPQVGELRVEQPAGGRVAAQASADIRRVLRQGHAIGFVAVVAEAAEETVDDVGLGAAPGQHERTELPALAQFRRGTLRLAPADDLAVGDEQLAVVDQEGAAFLRQVQGLAVDVQGRAMGHDYGQPCQVDVLGGGAEMLLGQLAGQRGEVDVAAFDENRLRHATLAPDPFGQPIVAADELLQGVLLQHAAQGDAAGLVALDPGLHGGCGVSRQVRQLGYGQGQRPDRHAGNGVGLGLDDFPGPGIHRRHARLSCRRTVGQQCANQQDNQGTARVPPVGHLQGPPQVAAIRSARSHRRRPGASSSRRHCRRHRPRRTGHRESAPVPRVRRSPGSSSPAAGPP